MHGSDARRGEQAPVNQLHGVLAVAAKAPAGADFKTAVPQIAELLLAEIDPLVASHRVNARHEAAHFDVRHDQSIGINVVVMAADALTARRRAAFIAALHRVHVVIAREHGRRRNFALLIEPIGGRRLSNRVILRHRWLRQQARHAHHLRPGRAGHSNQHQRQANASCVERFHRTLLTRLEPSFRDTPSVVHAEDGLLVAARQCRTKKCGSQKSEVGNQHADADL